MAILSTQPIDYTVFYQQDFFQGISKKTQEVVKQEVDSIQAHEMWYHSNGRKVKGFIVTPKDTGKKYPVILYARGGSKEYGNIGGRVLTLVLAEIASWGFVVLATQYSGNDGSEGKDELSGMDLDDLENLKQVAEDLEYADISNIQAIGMSRGGLMVGNLWRRVNWLKKVVLQVPELDLIDNYQRFPKLREFRADMYDVNNNDLNQQKSPIYHVKQLHPSTKAMIIQGGQDTNVNPQKTIEFYKLLQASGIDVQFHYFEEEDHHTQGVIRQIRELRKEFLLAR